MVIIQGVDAACAGRNRTTATSVAFKLGHIADAPRQKETSRRPAPVRYACVKDPSMVLPAAVFPSLQIHQCER